MIKRLDKLVLQSFFPPLVATIGVVTFILLCRQLMYYFDELIGKGIDLATVLELIGNLIILTLPMALPVALLFAALITYGAIAEHFELSAIKASGISPVRIVRPLMAVVVFLSVIIFLVNNELVPRVALKTYSLIYDLRQKRPSMAISPGTFYEGIDNIRIKVEQKFPSDPDALKDILIYDHRDGLEIITADSGRLSLLENGRAMKLALFDGYNYTSGGLEQIGEHEHTIDSSSSRRTSFSKSEMIVDLSGLQLQKTNPALFKGNRLVSNLAELDTLIARREAAMERKKKTARFEMAERERDRFAAAPDAFFYKGAALERARHQKAMWQALAEADDSARLQIIGYQIQWHRILASSVACVAFVLVGAPLGLRIGKGGFGAPFLVSLVMFIVYMVLGMEGENLANARVISAAVAVWLPIMALALVGGALLWRAKSFH